MMQKKKIIKCLYIFIYLFITTTKKSGNKSLLQCQNGRLPGQLARSDGFSRRPVRYLYTVVKAGDSVLLQFILIGK